MIESTLYADGSAGMIDMKKNGMEKSNYHYKGRIVTLIPRMEGYMWTCQYLITKSGRTEMDGSTDKTYLSREEAECAALSAARTFIDHCQLDKDPLG